MQIRRFFSYFWQGTIHILRQQKDWAGGGVQKRAVFADVQYCIYANIVGGSEKVQKYADVICI